MFNQKEHDKKYYQEHKEEKKLKVKKYRTDNPEKYHQIQKGWRDKHKKEIKRYSKKWREENFEYCKKWREENPERNKENQKKYQKNRRKIDLQYRLDCNISSAIYIALKGEKAGRKWENLVGYTIDNLMTRLEFNFNEKMNWQNYGDYWWIDHKKPRSLFHFNSAEDQTFRDCWCLANLQPLEKMANLKKHNYFKGQTS